MSEDEQEEDGLRNTHHGCVDVVAIQTRMLSHVEIMASRGRARTKWSTGRKRGGKHVVILYLIVRVAHGEIGSLRSLAVVDVGITIGGMCRTSHAETTNIHREAAGRRGTCAKLVLGFGYESTAAAM